MIESHTETIYSRNIIKNLVGLILQTEAGMGSQNATLTGESKILVP